VNAKSYDVAVAALQASIAEMPTESTSARTRKEIITYVPHFWLGIAKFNLGDIDGALREWKISEEQGAISKTEYYPRLRDFVSRAQSEKVRSAQNAASGAKGAADAALSRALSGQMEALSAGGDRSDTYRAAQRKLQEALSQFNAAGTDIKAYERAEGQATQAKELFAKATDDAKKQKASRPAVVPKPMPTPSTIVQQVVPTPQPPAPQPPPPVVVVVEQPKQQTDTAPAVEMIAPAPEPAPAVAKATQPAPSMTPAIALHLPPATSRDLLQFAYRAYATGDLDLSEKTLSSMLTTSPSSEAYLLRGCARYARAILSRNEALLAEATQDFKTALKLNRALRLDKKTFSPKLIAFFEQVRKAS
jgi:tetratricopeptide (TPR) repeat protein